MTPTRNIPEAPELWMPLYKGVGPSGVLYRGIPLLIQHSLISMEKSTIIMMDCDLFFFFSPSRIIGLYISVVLVIGSFIRNYISQLPSRLLVDEIVNPDPLLQLCSDIFLVRENRHFRLEEILVGKLFFIFRSPERIIKLTEHAKPKQD